MFVLQEGYSISENGRDFLGRRHTYPYPFLFENRNFFFVFKMKKKNNESRPLVDNFCISIRKKTQKWQKILPPLMGARAFSRTQICYIFACDNIGSNTKA